MTIDGEFLINLHFADDMKNYSYAQKHHKNYNRCYKNYTMKVGEWVLKGHCIEFKFYADDIHSGLIPPG